MRLLALLLASTVALAVAPPAFAADAFHSPTGNIGCAWADGELRCDIGTRHWSGVPKKPSWCHFDWALGFRMTRSSRVRWVCGSDTVLGLGPVLRYGSSWRHHQISCTMRRTGLTCHNRARHGFFMSRERWRRF